jgi:hypothetical protein
LLALLVLVCYQKGGDPTKTQKKRWYPHQKKKFFYI